MAVWVDLSVRRRSVCWNELVSTPRPFFEMLSEKKSKEGWAKMMIGVFWHGDQVVRHVYFFLVLPRRKETDR